MSYQPITTNTSTIKLFKFSDGKVLQLSGGKVFAFGSSETSYDPYAFQATAQTWLRVCLLADNGQDGDLGLKQGIVQGEVLDAATVPFSSLKKGFTVWDGQKYVLKAGFSSDGTRQGLKYGLRKYNIQE